MNNKILVDRFRINFLKLTKNCGYELINGEKFHVKQKWIVNNLWYIVKFLDDSIFLYQQDINNCR